MVELTPIQISLYKLVEVFVARQEVVLKAMKELRPDIVARYEGTYMPEMLAQLTLEYSRHPQTGYWGENQEWEYFLHGGGCRLTHRTTGEPIEWDVGSLKRFDKTWFVNWLIWLVETFTRSGYADNSSKKDKIRDDVYRVLEELEKGNLLTKENQYYKLHTLNLDC
jgi:hypothetical protein